MSSLSRHVSELSGSFWTFRGSVAPPADRGVERRTGTARIGEAGGEPDPLDEAFCLDCGLHLARRLAAPPLVPVVFDLVRQVLGGARSWRHETF